MCHAEKIKIMLSLSFFIFYILQRSKLLHHKNCNVTKLINCVVFIQVLYIYHWKPKVAELPKYSHVSFDLVASLDIS